MSLRVPLQLHPDSRCDALTGIEVEVARTAPRRLQVGFVLLGEARHVKWAQPGPPVRADQLWRHTCLEVFLRAGRDAGYFEFNLTPAGKWAAYRFRAYREGMEAAEEIGEPYYGVYMPPPPNQSSRCLAAELQLDKAFHLPLDAPWSLGLSAVIEEKNGRISYWALAHPPGKPDFHHPDCFRLQLPAARRP